MAFGVMEGIALASLVAQLFGGKQRQESTGTTETVTPPYQPKSALYGRLEAPITQMLLGQFGRLQGAGYPGGAGLGGGTNDMISQLMEYLSKNWQEIMGGGTTPPPGRGPGLPPRDRGRGADGFLGR